MNFKMKTTVFKVFTTLYITLLVSWSAVPVLSSMSAKSNEKDENSIIKKHFDKENEILVGLKVEDLKFINSEMLRKMAITVHEQMMASREFHRQRRSFNPKVEGRLRKEIKKDDSTLSRPVMPPKLNKDKNSQQSNENEEDDEVNELPDPPNSSEQDNSQHESSEFDHSHESSEFDHSHESNESNNPRESNESNNPRESNESNNPRESNESNNPRESNESNNPRESNEPDNSQKSNESDNSQKSNESEYPDTKSYEFDFGPKNNSVDTEEEEEEIIPLDKIEPPAKKHNFTNYIT